MMKRLTAASAAILMAGTIWAASAGAISCIPENPAGCPTTTTWTNGLSHGTVPLTHHYGTPYAGAPKTTTTTVAVDPPVAVAVAATPQVTG